MKIRFAAYALALLLAVATLALPSTAPFAHAAAARRADTAGSIAGTVVNGTHGNAPVPGQAVTLQVSVKSGPTQNVTTTTTDAKGHFSFTGLDASGDSVYVLDTHFESGDFGSGAITFSSGAAQNAALTVYDTSANDAALSVSVATILFSPPNKQTGVIPVGEFISFKNSGNTAFVGTTAPANGLPMGLLRFALPAGATNLTVGQGFGGSQAIQVGSGFGSTATVPPGTSQFAFVFDVPYTGTDYVFHFKAEYPTASVVVLVPTNVLTDAGDFAAKPPVNALGQQYQMLQASNVKSGAQLSTRLWNLPLPGEQPDLDFRWLFALAAALALLLALLLGLYLRRGNLAVALGLLPASALAPRDSAEERARTDAEREAERKRLLKSLLALENQHAAGEVDGERYERRREELRHKIKALLLAEPEQSVEQSVASDNDDGEAAVTVSAPQTTATAEEPRPSAPNKRQAVGGRR